MTTNKRPAPVVSTVSIDSNDSQLKQKDEKITANNAGLEFPYARIKAQMTKRSGRKQNISTSSAIVIAAVAEYVIAEICELANNAAVEEKSKRVHPRQLQLAIRQDEELARFIGNGSVAGGGKSSSLRLRTRLAN